MSKSIQIEMCIRACAKLEGQVCTRTSFYHDQKIMLNVKSVVQILMKYSELPTYPIKNSGVTFSLFSPEIVPYELDETFCPHKVEKNIYF